MKTARGTYALCFFVALVLMVAAPVFAQEPATSQLSFTAATTLEAQVEYVYSMNLGENLKLKLVEGISPVSLSSGANLFWVPVPFLEFKAGASVGTGWNIPGLAYGLALNTDQNSDERVLERKDFGGVVLIGELGGAFQFDYAALVPGDWNHIVLKTYHGFKYKTFTGALDDQAWLYLADGGENVNGLNYYGNLFLGYQMPLFIDTAGLLVEADLYLNDLPNRTVWGDDMVRWVMGAIFNFKFSDTWSLATLAQLKTVRNFIASAGEDEYGYYRNRIVDTADPLRIEFYRLAGIVTWKL